MIYCGSWGCCSEVSRLYCCQCVWGSDGDTLEQNNLLHFITPQHNYVDNHCEIRRLAHPYASIVPVSAQA